MKKHSAILKSLFIIFLFSAALAAQTSEAVKTSSITRKSSDSTTAKSATTVAKIESDMAEALTLIQDNYVNSNKLNYNEVFKSSIDGMLHTLDPHSNYFDAQEYEQFRTDQNSQYFGIGATIGDLRDPQGKVIATYIKATFENAPAHRAGLHYGDKIVDVNGTSMLGKGFVEVRGFLRGPRGTTAKITVEKFDTGKRETVEIIRDAVAQPSISEAYMIRPGTGYIAMSGGFNTTTYNEFKEAMRDLKAQGMQQVILDLRFNGGGLVNQAEKVANTFLQKGQTIFTQTGRVSGANEVSKAINPNPETMPVIMLVNRSSASASEILAGALQDHDRALIVGESTFGKALVTNPWLLEYGSMVLLTIAKYQTPSGRVIQRDYSKGSLYDYYNSGRSTDGDEKISAPTGEETKTDSGRKVYGGGGITPDVIVKADTITAERARQQSKLIDPIFAFALDLVSGKNPEFSNYAVKRQLVFNYNLKSADFPVTENLLAAFKKYAVEKYKVSSALVDREKELIQRILRIELVTAAYGSTTSNQVTNEYDNQILKSFELFPQAKQLALEGMKASQKQSLNQNNQ